MTSENTRTFKSESLHMAVHKFFQDMKRKEHFCDLLFHIGGKVVLAHRIVIAAVMPYYRRILLNDKESGEGNEDQKEYTIQDNTDSTAFENLVEFAYNGEIVITNENVRSLLCVALQFEVEEVSEACCDYLVDSLNRENVFNILNFSFEKRCTELQKNVADFISENFNELSQVEELSNVPFQFLEELLSKDDLRVSSEEKVFSSVMKWVKKCPEQRKTHLPELLKKVRMTLLKPRFLKDSLASEFLIHESIACRDLLDEARNYHFFPEDRSVLNNFCAEPRCKDFSTSSTMDNERMYTITVFNECRALHFNEQAQTWNTGGSNKLYHLISSSAVVGSKIYYFYGNEMIEYDVSKNTFKTYKNLPCSKIGSGAASLNGKLYLCGGQNSFLSLNTAECYDPETDAWQKIRDMKECRAYAGVTTLGECIYVIGGRGVCIHKSVEKYDLHSGKWRLVPSMLTERYDFGCTILKGRIYACGGITCGNVYTQTAEVYDPIENQWIFISSVSSLRRNTKLLPYHGKLYAFGGRDSYDKWINVLEIYDPDSRKWELKNETNRDYYIAAAAVISPPVV